MEKKKVLPLSGIRVLDLTIFQMGPLASMMLADLGAEVIHVEKPHRGDVSRGSSSVWGRSLLLPNGESIFWHQANRNKKSITIDLRKSAARDVLYRLTKNCDVFVTNLASETQRQLGTDKESILRVNPDIIYVACSAWGSKGPDADLPGQDTTALARSGFMMITPGSEEEPLPPVGIIADTMGGTMAAFGAVTALLARERVGVNPEVDVSLLSSMMWLQYTHLSELANVGYEFMTLRRKQQTNPLFNVYKCQDGKWICLGFARPDKLWHDFCTAVEMPELENDPHFKDQFVRKEEGNYQALISILDRLFASKPRQEWVDLFRKWGFWSSVVNTVSDLPDDPQVIANDYLTEFDSGFKFVKYPFELVGCDTPLKGRAPELGEHTEEVLLGVGGYSWEEISRLKDDGIV